MPRGSILALAALVPVAACARGVMVTGEGPEPRASVSPVVVASSEAVPSGTELVLRLDSEVGTQISRPGDAFYATLLSPVLGPRREILLPQGARVSGTVTEVRPSTDITRPAVIRLDFYRIYWNANQRSAPFKAEIVGTSPPEREGRTAQEVLRGAAAGAAAGAVLGAVIGRDVESAVTGAAVGAGAGTLISLGTANQQARLPVGTTLRVRLLEPVPVR